MEWRKPAWRWGWGWGGIFDSPVGEAIGDDVDDVDDDDGDDGGGGDCERGEVFGGEIGRGVFFSGLSPALAWLGCV